MLMLMFVLENPKTFSHTIYQNMPMIANNFFQMNNGCHQRRSNENKMALTYHCHLKTSSKS